MADLPATLSDAGAPETYVGTRVSANAFHLVRERPILGPCDPPSNPRLARTGPESPSSEAIGYMTSGS